MKLKATKKSIKENYNRIIGIGSCNAQHLLKYSNAFGYSSGSNGWACDYYEVGNVCISTGYSYIHGIKYKYDLLDHYEKLAQLVGYDNSIRYEDKAEKVNQLLEQFINEVTK